MFCYVIEIAFITSLFIFAEVSELADELDSGSSGSFCRVGSSPIFRTMVMGLKVLIFQGVRLFFVWGGGIEGWLVLCCRSL